VDAMARLSNLAELSGRENPEDSPSNRALEVAVGRWESNPRPSDLDYAAGVFVVLRHLVKGQCDLGLCRYWFSSPGNSLRWSRGPQADPEGSDPHLHTNDYDRESRTP
jgi:hypothetical protein